MMNFRALDTQPHAVLTCSVTQQVPSSFIPVFLSCFLLNAANPGSHLYNELNLTRSCVITVQSQCFNSPEMPRSFCNTFLGVIFHVSTVEIYLGTDLDRDSPVHRYGFDLIFRLFNYVILIVDLVPALSLQAVLSHMASGYRLMQLKGNQFCDSY